MIPYLSYETSKFSSLPFYCSFPHVLGERDNFFLSAYFSKNSWRFLRIVVMSKNNAGLRNSTNGGQL